ncbi:hypothetical protein B0H10DRAFT_2270100 [Mycena sp. CBHHK59/15]|nr:hypothetical protein B0H10DRAFT_2270100 [Mycena sp. CBHHK59/15]
MTTCKKISQKVESQTNRPHRKGDACSSLTGSVSLMLQNREEIQAVPVSGSSFLLKVKTEVISGGVPKVRILLFETTTTRGANFSIQYSLELRILRGKLMHGKQRKDKLGFTFGFFSMRQPGPPSMLRQLAYQENSPLLSPEADPEVWQSLPSFSNSGLLFSVLKLDVKCTLCYTRSTSIPCALTIEMANTHALDVLTSPTAALERRTRSPGGADTLELCGQAIFKASTEGAAVDASSRRQLMGEIHLRRTLQPSTDMIDFLIEWFSVDPQYTVLVLPFQVTSFKPHRYEALLLQKVYIVTKYASGPRARMYTPATYETHNTPHSTTTTVDELCVDYTSVFRSISSPCPHVFAVNEWNATDVRKKLVSTYGITAMNGGTIWDLWRKWAWPCLRNWRVLGDNIKCEEDGEAGRVNVREQYATNTGERAAAHKRERTNVGCKGCRHNGLSRHEGYFYLFDTLPLWMAMSLFCVVCLADMHPELKGPLGSCKTVEARYD